MSEDVIGINAVFFYQNKSLMVDHLKNKKLICKQKNTNISTAMLSEKCSNLKKKLCVFCNLF